MYLCQVRATPAADLGVYADAFQPLSRTAYAQVAPILEQKKELERKQEDERKKKEDEDAWAKQREDMRTEIQTEMRREQ